MMKHLLIVAVCVLFSCGKKNSDDNAVTPNNKGQQEGPGNKKSDDPTSGESPAEYNVKLEFLAPNSPTPDLWPNSFEKSDAIPLKFNINFVFELDQPAVIQLKKLTQSMTCDSFYAWNQKLVTADQKVVNENFQVSNPVDLNAGKYIFKIEFSSSQPCRQVFFGFIAIKSNKN